GGRRPVDVPGHALVPPPALAVRADVRALPRALRPRALRAPALQQPLGPDPRDPRWRSPPELGRRHAQPRDPTRCPRHAGRARAPAPARGGGAAARGPEPGSRTSVAARGAGRTAGPGRLAIGPMNGIGARSRRAGHAMHPGDKRLRSRGIEAPEGRWSKGGPIVIAAPHSLEA